MSKTKATKPAAREQVPMFAEHLIAPDPALVAIAEAKALEDAKERRRLAAATLKKEDAFIAEKIREFNERTGL
jgi:hypothetical protein